MIDKYDTYLILNFPWFHWVQRVQPLFQASVQLWLVELKKESDNFHVSRVSNKIILKSTRAGNNK